MLDRVPAALAVADLHDPSGRVAIRGPRPYNFGLLHHYRPHHLEQEQDTRSHR